mmetsp:Transcript_27008/g.30350  ORF Transcript_27008/g.30350 Transcript_27008/m.30350 type:complete len:151 (-) Transcript_27008:132-584(-)
MQLLRRKNDVPQVLLLVVSLLLMMIDTTFCFQHHCSLTSSRGTSTSTGITPTTPGVVVVVLNLSMPPQFPNNNNDENDTNLSPTQLPKLKLPSLPTSFSMPEIDTEALLKKIGVVAATILAFVLIQKVGLYVSEIVTPELTAEEVREFRL